MSMSEVFNPTPPKPSEVLEFAKALRDNDQMWKIFRKNARFGLPDASEVAALDSFRSEWLERNRLRDLNVGGLNAAYRLLRKLSIGEIEDLDDPIVVEFLEADAHRNKVEHKGAMVKTTSTSVEEVMWLARALFDEPTINASFKRVVANDSEFTNEEVNYIHDFCQNTYGKKYGTYNRGSIQDLAMKLIWQLLYKKISSLESEEAWAIVRNSSPKLYNIID